MIDVFIYVLLAVNVLVSILLVILVLMQRPKSEGLGAAFGGGVTDSLFGAQTSDVLTKSTIVLGTIFMLVTLTLAILYAHRTPSEDKLKEELLKGLESAPASLVQPATTPEPNEAK